LLYTLPTSLLNSFHINPIKGPNVTENKELVLLEDISAIIAGSHEVEKTLDRITELITSRLGVDVCTIYAHEGDELILKATRGLLPEAVGKVSMSVGEGLTGATFRSGTPLNVQDADEHPDFKFFPGIGEDALGSYLGIPLIHRGKTIGVLSVQTKVHRTFSPNEVRMMVAAAGQLSGIIEAVIHNKEEKPGGSARRDSFLRGTPASGGCGRGQLLVMTDEMDLDALGECPCESMEEALEHFEEALLKAEEEVKVIHDHVSSALGKEEGAIFHAHLMMLRDEHLRDKVRILIKNGAGPVAAVVRVAHEYIDAFLAIEDPYLRERASDVRDIAHRVVSHLRPEGGDSETNFDSPVIVVAVDLTPSQASQIIQPNLKGVVLLKGGVNSHTSILCRSAGIPAIAGAGGEVDETLTGSEGIIDGNTGILYIDPSPHIVEEYSRLEDDLRELDEELRAHLNEEVKTLDGEKVNLQGNAALLSDVPRIVEFGAAGIGLYRTEFPFLIRTDLPDEETQYEIYSRAVKGMEGLPITFRTLDIGGDKPLPYMPITHEENPQLGWRSIRISFSMEELFRVQVRALLRASEHGPIRIMFPMVTDPGELKKARLIVEEERERAAIPEEREIPIGAMMEVPAAVVLIDQLAKYADFFSIGSNDLAQYILAVDRGNAIIGHLYDTMHPAVMRTISTIAEASAKSGTHLGICGELSGKPLGVAALIALGLRDFSATPSALMKIRRLLQCIDAKKLSDLKPLILSASSPDEVRGVVRDLLEKGGVPEMLWR